MKKFKEALFGIIVGGVEVFKEIRTPLAVGVLIKFISGYSLTMCCVVMLLIAMLFNSSKNACRNICKQTDKCGNSWVYGVSTYFCGWLAIMVAMAGKAFVEPVGVVAALVVAKFVLLMMISNKELRPFD